MTPQPTRIAQRLLHFYTSNGWTRQAFARSRKVLPLHHPLATHFCLDGARHVLATITNPEWSAFTGALRCQETPHRKWTTAASLNRHFKTKGQLLCALRRLAAETP